MILTKFSVSANAVFSIECKIVSNMITEQVATFCGVKSIFKINIMHDNRAFEVAIQEGYRLVRYQESILLSYLAIL